MLEKRIQGDYVKAMKDRETLKAGTLSFLRAQLKNVMIDKHQESLPDEDVIAVIKKQVKQRQESIVQYEQGGRQDLADKERRELEFLKSYLPPEMPLADLEALVAGVIKETGAVGSKDMGLVMKGLIPKVAGRSDNKTVSDVVKKMLSSL